MIVLSREPETIVFPSGEKATERTQSLWAFVFSLFKVREAASTGREALVSSRSRLAVEKNERTPDFDRAYYWPTCRWLALLIPATDVVLPVSIDLLVIPFPRTDARDMLLARKLHFLPLRGVIGTWVGRIPDFERAGASSRHNLLPIRRELHGVDAVRVCVLLSLEIQCSCQERQKVSV